MKDLEHYIHHLERGVANAHAGQTKKVPFSTGLAVAFLIDLADFIPFAQLPVSGEVIDLLQTFAAYLYFRDPVFIGDAVELALPGGLDLLPTTTVLYLWRRFQ